LSTLELKVASGPKAGKTFALSSGELVFGRTKGDVVIDWDASTSSRHFKIEKQSERFFLHDLGSTNGTFVNGNTVTSVQLNHGDKVLAGSTLFAVHMLAPAPIASPRFVPAPESSIESSKDFDPYAEVKTAPREKLKPAEQKTTDPGLNKTRLTGRPNTVLRQVRLRITSKEQQGTVYWLGPGQSLVFGRTAKSDCCLAFDATLSSRHFSITCHQDHCDIQDLESLAGTQLNGRSITKDRLFNGDQVKAGLTTLAVEVEGVDGPVVRTGADAAAMPASPTPVSPSEIEATRSQCASGLTRIRGKLATPEIVLTILDVLQQSPSLYLLIDFARLSLPVPEAIDLDACKLFRWIPAVAAAQTPLLMTCDELPDWKAYIEEAWGSDAFVGIHSKLPKKELLEKLRERLTESSRGPATAQGIIGFCWPSVLESLLENDLHGFVERFFTSATLVLTEVAGDTENWQTYSPVEPTKLLKALQVKLIDSRPKE
jgi:pSer/pThr/pTyr-binding forkhead associated (FHA) protein